MVTPSPSFETRTADLLNELSQTGQTKYLRHITSPMGPTVILEDQGEVICLCSNNYLGLADHPAVISAGVQGLRKYGAGTASVRFICGTFDCHRDLEQTIARFCHTEAALTYVSCWCANEALLTTITLPGDVIFSDALNHASLIDGIRLTRKVDRAVYKHNDLADLERQLQNHMDKPVRWVVTDGVFSMEGDLANLPGLVTLCKKYDARLIVDDSHGTGALGVGGRGTPEHFNLLGQIDILTGTLGKALGGAAGGYVAASGQVIDLLIQRSRPSLFSNALPATVACSANKAIEIIEQEPQRMAKLTSNVAQLRQGLNKLGYPCPPAETSPTAIIPIIVGETADAIAKSQRLMELGVWVIGFGYPVVPQGQARLRIQVSAALEKDHIEKALDAFSKL